MIDNEKNIAFWDRVAKESGVDRGAFAGMLMEGRAFESIYRREAEQARFLKLFTPTLKSNVLEVGSGGGRWGMFLADKVGSYVGIDISSNMVAIAEEARKQLQLLNVRYECCSLPELSTDNRFEIVYFSGVLQYMDDEVVEQCIAKAASLLAPGGAIISRDSVQKVSRVEKSGDYPVIYRTESEYRAFFEGAGFRQECSCLSYDPKRFTNLSSRLFAIPGITYGMACSFRDVLCTIDNMLGNPGFLKTRNHRLELKQVNLQEHRFSKYSRN